MSAMSGKPEDRRATPPDPRDQGRLVCTGIAEGALLVHVAAFARSARRLIEVEPVAPPPRCHRPAPHLRKESTWN
jgi:hypothetical protein